MLGKLKGWINSLAVENMSPTSEEDGPQCSKDMGIIEIERKFNEIEQGDQWSRTYNKLRCDSDKRWSKLQIKVARKPENMRRNRYRDVLAYDHSRVRLRCDDNDYINASVVPIPAAHRKHILCQGPLPHTTGHFWEMIWEQNTTVIIMLNRVIEKNTIKCHQYFPSTETEEQSLVFANGYEATLISEQVLPNFTKRILRLCYPEKTENREIIHFQYTTWPDFGVPANTGDFLEFLLEVRKSDCLNGESSGPPVIHCSAGIGRSGSFILVDASLVIAQINSPAEVDILDMVSELRQFRVGLIQTPDQLRFTWKAVIDALQQERWKELLSLTCIPAHDLQEDSTQQQEFVSGVGAAGDSKDCNSVGPQPDTIGAASPTSTDTSNSSGRWVDSRSIQSDSMSSSSTGSSPRPVLKRSQGNEKCSSDLPSGVQNSSSLLPTEENMTIEEEREEGMPDLIENVAPCLTAHIDTGVMASLLIDPSMSVESDSKIGEIPSEVNRTLLDDGMVGTPKKIRKDDEHCDATGATTDTTGRASTTLNNVDTGEITVGDMETSCTEDEKQNSSVERASPLIPVDIASSSDSIAEATDHNIRSGADPGIETSVDVYNANIDSPNNPSGTER